MKKVIRLLLSLIILLGLSACGFIKDDNREVKPQEIIHEEVKNETISGENRTVKHPLVKIEELPIQVQILDPDSIGTRYLEAVYKNDSKYIIKGLSITVLLKDKNERTYLAIYDNVLPGDTSPKFETFAPESGKLEDCEFLIYEITVEKSEGNMVHIKYDVNGNEYNWF